MRKMSARLSGTARPDLSVSGGMDHNRIFRPPVNLEPVKAVVTGLWSFLP